MIGLNMSSMCHNSPTGHVSDQLWSDLIVIIYHHHHRPHPYVSYRSGMPQYRHHRRYRITEGADEIQMRRVAGYLFGYMNQQKPKGVG